MLLEIVFIGDSTDAGEEIIQVCAVLYENIFKTSERRN